MCQAIWNKHIVFFTNGRIPVRKLCMHLRGSLYASINHPALCSTNSAIQTKSSPLIIFQQRNWKGVYEIKSRNREAYCCLWWIFHSICKMCLAENDCCTTVDTLSQNDEHHKPWNKGNRTNEPSASNHQSNTNTNGEIIRLCAPCGKCTIREIHSRMHTLPGYCPVPVRTCMRFNHSLLETLSCYLVIQLQAFVRVSCVLHQANWQEIVLSIHNVNDVNMVSRFMFT